MSFETDYLEMFPRVITITPFASEDSGGKPSYGSPRTAQCHIRDDVKLWKWEDGVERQSRRTVYVSDQAIGLKDKITMPAGYDPQTVFPVFIVRRDDEDGYHHTEIYL